MLMMIELFGNKEVRIILKKLQIFLIILIIINVIALIYLLIVPKIETLNYEQYASQHWNEDRVKVFGEEKIAEEEKDQQELQDLYQVQIENETELLSNYTGELLTTTATDKIRELVKSGFEKFYTDTKGMNASQLEQYFNTNKDDIAMQTGLTTVDDFADFINKIQIYKNNIEYTKVEIEEGSFVYEEEYSHFKIKITYNDGSILEFTVYMGNKDFMDTPLVIIR